MSAITSASVPGARSSIAVITVCRNALHELQMTVASVREQVWPALFHVVVDGGSTDGTPEWLLAHENDFSFALSEPDSGIYDAMNKAIARCPPVDWMIFLNAGDRFIDSSVLMRLSPLLTTPSDFIFGDVAIRSGMRQAVVKVRPQARLEMPGCHQSTLVRASVMRELLFDTSYRVGGDFEFFLRATTPHRRVAFHDGVIAEVAPEGFSAANEDVLRRDYARAIGQHRGRGNALAWSLRRRSVRAVRYVLARLRFGEIAR